VWCTTSNFAPKSGYSLSSVLKQCGHVVTIGLAALLLVGVERRDVLLGEHHEEVLVARAARGVAGAGLLLAEDGEVDAACFMSFAVARAIFLARSS
jgi:hypothetical protein